MLSQHSKHLNTKRDSEPGTRCMYAHEVPVDQHWSKCPPKAKGGGGVPRRTTAPTVRQEAFQVFANCLCV